MEFRNKYSLDFVFIVGAPNVMKINDRGVKRKASISNGSGNGGSNQDKSQDVNAASDPVVAQFDNKSLSTKQAQKKLKLKLKGKKVSEEIRPVPKGKSQFMIGHSMGKTRKLLTLYDTGC